VVSRDQPRFTKALLVAAAFASGCLAAACSPAQRGPTTEAPQPGEDDEDAEPSSLDLTSSGPPLPRAAPPSLERHFDAEGSARARSGQHVLCGKRYMEIFNTTPRGPNAEQALYNAMRCFRAGRAVGAAITSARMLVARFPISDLTGDALLTIGQLSSAIALFAPAADAYEIFARKFARHPEAKRSLLRALRLRLGLGQHARATRDAEHFERLYGNKHPAESAAATFAAVAGDHAGSDADLVIESLQSYLAKHADEGGGDRAIVARTRLGLALWRKSCRVPTIDGTCAVARDLDSALPADSKGTPSRCPGAPRTLLVAIARDPDLAARAQSELRTALAQWNQGAAANAVDADDRDARLDTLIEAVAAAKFHLAEPAYEAALASQPPAGLADLRPAQARRALRAWLKTRAALVKKARAGFRDARRLEGWTPSWSVAADARAGQLHLAMADAVLTAPVPRHLRAGKPVAAKLSAHCAAQKKRASADLGAAARAYGLCNQEATQGMRGDSWMRLCRRELVRLQPDAFPPLRELHDPPTRHGVVGDEHNMGKAYWKLKLERNQKVVLAHYSLAWLAFAARGNAKDAAARRDLATDVRKHASSLYALLYLQNGAVDELARADLLLIEAQGRDSKHAPLWNVRGILERQRGNLGAARRMFARALSLDPRYRVALLNAADAALEAQSFESARDLFITVRKQSTGNYSAQNGLGIAYRGLGKLALAEKSYLAAQKIAPDRGEALFNLGVLYADALAPGATNRKQTIKRTLQAKAHFERFLAAANATPDHLARARKRIADCEARVAALTK